MFSKIIREVMKTFSVSKEALFRSRRGESNPARFAAITLARELSGLKHSEIADLFKIKSHHTVGSSCHRFKRLIQKDKPIHRRYLKIYNTCSQEKAGIRFEDKTVDSVKTPGPSSLAEGPEVSVVTGEPVVVSAKGKRADGATAEDKTGGMAVKVQY